MQLFSLDLFCRQFFAPLFCPVMGGGTRACFFPHTTNNLADQGMKEAKAIN
jgi:hypothetical protein